MTGFKVGDRVRIVESQYSIPALGVGGTGTVGHHYGNGLWGVTVDNYDHTPEHLWSFHSRELELLATEVDYAPVEPTPDRFVDVEGTRLWVDHLAHIVDVLRAVETLQKTLDGKVGILSDLEFVLPSEGIDIQIDGIPTGWKINYRDDYWALEV